VQFNNFSIQVTDYELKPGGRNIRVTEETKQEYVDLVAEHILTTAIRPQINGFLEGFTELVPRDLISLFNDKELELLISGLPEIDREWISSVWSNSSSYCISYYFLSSYCLAMSSLHKPIPTCLGLKGFVVVSYCVFFPCSG